ncbi:MAG: RIP metalloprotease RseP [Alphaproteobacteria bacterium]|nr:RIP metalloprotease RseP [Alphaproteobacteria bacterium]
MESILSFIQHYALPFIVVIGIVVFVHEFGHYLVARLCGIRVESFSIGFGRTLFKWTDKRGTVWRIGCLPLGGYVKMFGDADAASTPDDSVHTMTEDEKKISFFHQPVGKRIAVIAAGPAFNYLFAVVALAFLFVGVGQPFSPPLVGALQEGSAAAQAGIEVGDRFLSIDGTPMRRFEDIKRAVSLNTGSSVTVVVQRDGQEKTMVLTPKVVVQKDLLGGAHRLGRIGVLSTAVVYEKRTVPEALYYATVETWNISVDTLKAVGQVLIGTRGTEEIGGPLRIAEMSGTMAREGFWPLVWFLAVISINLGLINLFPVPLLDGGHLLFYSIEAVLGRPINETAQEVGFRIGLVLVLSLMVFATWNDLVYLQIVSRIKDLFS